MTFIDLNWSKFVISYNGNRNFNKSSIALGLFDRLVENQDILSKDNSDGLKVYSGRSYENNIKC